MSGRVKGSVLTSFVISYHVSVLNLSTHLIKVTEELDKNGLQLAHVSMLANNTQRHKMVEFKDQLTHYTVWNFCYL